MIRFSIASNLPVASRTSGHLLVLRQAGGKALISTRGLRRAIKSFVVTTSSSQLIREGALGIFGQAVDNLLRPDGLLAGLGFLL